MDTEKVKAFVARSLDECEQEGLTLEEVSGISLLLRATLSSRVEEIHRRVNVNGVRVVR